jgi:hypothetical protein
MIILEGALNIKRLLKTLSNLTQRVCLTCVCKSIRLFTSSACTLKDLNPSHFALTNVSMCVILPPAPPADGRKQASHPPAIGSQLSDSEAQV